MTLIIKLRLYNTSRADETLKRILRQKILLKGCQKNKSRAAHFPNIIRKATDQRSQITKHYNMKYMFWDEALYLVWLATRALLEFDDVQAETKFLIHEKMGNIYGLIPKSKENTQMTRKTSCCLLRKFSIKIRIR